MAGFNQVFTRNQLTGFNEAAGFDQGAGLDESHGLDQWEWRKGSPPIAGGELREHASIVPGLDADRVRRLRVYLTSSAAASPRERWCKPS